MTLAFLILISQLPNVTEGGILSVEDVVINEFMAQPRSSVTEADGEWIELYNNTDEWVNLADWMLSNSYGESVVLSTYLLPPEGYFVICGCSDQTQNGGVVTNQVFGDFRIRESGGIALYNSSRSIVDCIEYDGGWPVMPGVSCERINPGWVSNSSSSWDYCTVVFGMGDMGTPGSQNSVYQNSFAQNSWAFIKAFVQ
ncbi:MAG: hypothetical protein AVO35_06345 [Candidatus Aegiribacteria sp. MLS_C]|nr:MAG: hypothetical protein AVO35_06345 [Candidatus Aegiribacteria sp. MLS_C]